VHLFFEGQMSREVVASAFLGTILTSGPTSGMRSSTRWRLCWCGTLGVVQDQFVGGYSREHQVDIRLDPRTG